LEKEGFFGDIQANRMKKGSLGKRKLHGAVPGNEKQTVDEIKTRQGVFIQRSPVAGY